MEQFIFDLSIVLVGSAIFSYMAVLSKQPIIIAYVLCGVCVGPWGAGWITQAAFIESISHLGITLLLFLAGLCLHPQKLIRLFRKTTLVTMGSCAASFILAALVSAFFGFSFIDSVCIGLALMFSSTILTVKLLPTTQLHHKKMGAVCIGVLIMQDLLAISVLAFIRCFEAPHGVIIGFAFLLIKLVAFIAMLLLFEQFVLRKVMSRVDRFHEALFILGLAWCFGVAMISYKMNLFYETGAFFAGVVLARHPVSLFISEKLKPLRDFFLVLFFFTLGAKLDIVSMQDILVPAGVLAALFMVIKPWVIKTLFIIAGEDEKFAKETGVRLGQLSEFSLLVALLAFKSGHITNSALQLIQLVTIITFAASSYLVVFTYQTPIGTSAQHIKD